MNDLASAIRLFNGRCKQGRQNECNFELQVKICLRQFLFRIYEPISFDVIFFFSFLINSVRQQQQIKYMFNKAVNIPMVVYNVNENKIML